MKPIIDENALSAGHKQATVWQQIEDGLSEPALSLRTWEGGEDKLIEIKQGESEVLINAETIPELCKLMKRLLV